MRTIKNSTLLAALLLLTVRCTGTSGSSNGESGPPGATPLAPRTIQQHNLTATELKPISLQLQTSKAIPSLDTLPPGALYDGNTQTLRWIPKKGQAGEYNFVLGVTNNNVEHRLKVTVNSVSESQLRTGPFGIYKDGDVGYIFVHGAGDVDRCANSQDLEEYWGSSKNVIAPPGTAPRQVVCYDGRKDAEESAAQVAQQILQADCGAYNRCIIITHSMGGLILNHILTHTRTANADDPKPILFDNRLLYQAVKNRALFVISLGSSAGGSKVANMVEHPEQYGIDQSVINFIKAQTGYGPSGYTRSNETNYATQVLAPITADPEVPFFMVAGFSPKIVDEYADSSTIDSNEFQKIFNNDYELTALDTIAQFKSRSDGLVSFRSACGVASSNVEDGPGRIATIDQQLQYCYQAPKKANFYPWFAINLNHYLLASADGYNCSNSTNACRAYFANSITHTMEYHSFFANKNAAEIIRSKLTSGAASYNGNFDIVF